MGLAWLSLFFSWNVHMVVEAHKVLKKRRHRHRHFEDEEPEPVEENPQPEVRPSVIDIFNFLSENDDGDYSTVIKEIGTIARNKKSADNINRSRSCSDILATNIRTLERSPRHRRMISISEVFINAQPVLDKSKSENFPLIEESNGDPEPAECVKTDTEKNKDSCAFGAETNGIVFTAPKREAAAEEGVQNPEGGGTRFKISKVVEENLLMETDEKG